jgi:hypothetical protein
VTFRERQPFSRKMVFNLLPQLRMAARASEAGTARGSLPLCEPRPTGSRWNLSLDHPSRLDLILDANGAARSAANKRATVVCGAARRSQPVVADNIQRCVLGSLHDRASLTTNTLTHRY